MTRRCGGAIIGARRPTGRGHGASRGTAERIDGKRQYIYSTMHIASIHMVFFDVEIALHALIYAFCSRNCAVGRNCSAPILGIAKMTSSPVKKELAKQVTRIGRSTRQAMQPSPVATRFVPHFDLFLIGTIMRISTMFSLAAALTLCTSAMAAPATTSHEAGGEVMSVQTIQGATYKLSPVEFHGVQGRYHLSNGKMLKISSAQRKLFAEIGDDRTEIVAVGHNSFVSRGEGMHLVFDELQFANDVTLTGAIAAR